LIIIPVEEDKREKGVRVIFFHPSTMRFFPFTEPVLSVARFFAPLRMTASEGFRVRMTGSERVQQFTVSTLT
jgi:hypothetical protein